MRIFFQIHRIPEAKEPIPVVYRVTIQCIGLQKPDESGNEYEKGAFREMEIGDHLIDHLKRVFPVYE